MPIFLGWEIVVPPVAIKVKRLRAEERLRPVTLSCAVVTPLPFVSPARSVAKKQRKRSKAAAGFSRERRAEDR
jgi:hypothetical protein